MATKEEIAYANMRRQIQEAIGPFFTNLTPPNGVHAKNIRHHVDGVHGPILRQTMVFEVTYYLPSDWKTQVRAVVSCTEDGPKLEIDSPLGHESLEFIKMYDPQILNDTDLANAISLVEKHLEAATSAVEVMRLDVKQILVGQLETSITYSNNTTLLAMVSMLPNVDLGEGNVVALVQAGRSQAVYDVLEVSTLQNGKLQIHLRPIER